ncbi:MAG: IclR family transcriptional regulator, partial [Acidiferrobacterales bacterium]
SSLSMQRKLVMQSIERANQIIRHMMEVPEKGARLVDISQSTSLHKTTCYRILATLIRLGWVIQDSRTKRYRIGPELLGFGLSTHADNALLQIGVSAINRLTEVFNDSFYLSISSGFDALCIAQCEGNYPIRPSSLNVGVRRPLGVGAGGLALLAFRTDTDIDLTLENNAPRFLSFNDFNEQRCRQAIDTARQCGYTVHAGQVVAGLGGVGVPVRGPAGTPVFAISAGAVNDRLTQPRRVEIVEKMQIEASKIERLISSTSSANSYAGDLERRIAS